uniref:SurA N-terminal domain-containing protein n=1 Tax=Candidatus Kentrum sp. DK TaxID=2126562 RepID=A0A450SI23_9GAMM|nr:MAG: SurA N-terminal domain-containing protein [Candidatus Kentron sp. DK]VFJ56677.1 MAG: SurA N-terminal domain-containing protein [Candidatus Kentron sp. DK]
MLQGIRDRAQGWLAWVIVVLISVPFALWGIYEYLGGSTNLPVAEVDGVELNSAQFRQAYRRQQMHLRSILGEDFDLSVLNEEEIKRATLNDLINGEILLRTGLENGLRIGDQQLADAIGSRPLFREDGRFSEAVYHRWLRMLGYTPGSFEQEYRRSLLIDQIRYAIVDTALADAWDVGNTLRLQRQKRIVSLMTIPVALYLGNESTEEEIRGYHERNQSEFVTPERVSVRYLALSLDDLPDVPEPAEEELRVLFEQRAGDFAGTEAGADATRPSFEESRETLLADFQRGQKERSFFNVAEQLANLTFENPDTLAVATDNLGLTVEETGFFDRTGSLVDAASEENDAAGKTSEQAALIKNPEFVTAAFSEDVLQDENNSEPIELGEYHVVVLRRKEYLPASPQPLEAVRDKVIERLDVARARERVAELGEELIAQLQKDRTPASVAKAHGLVLREKLELGRGDTRETRAVVNKVFRMTRPETSKIVYDGVITDAGDYTLIGLDKVIEPPLTDAEAPLKTATANTLARTYGSDEYQAYLRTLRSDADIVIHEGNL